MISFWIVCSRCRKPRSEDQDKETCWNSVEFSSQEQLFGYSELSSTLLVGSAGVLCSSFSSDSMSCIETDGDEGADSGVRIDDCHVQSCKNKDQEVSLLSSICISGNTAGVARDWEGDAGGA